MAATPELKCSGRNLCKSCKAEEDLMRYYIDGISMRLIVHIIKQEIGCQKCEKFLPDYQLDFHHVGEKNNNMAKIISKGRIKTFLDEVLKCVILCSRCHREEHWGGRKLPYYYVMEDFKWN